MEIGALVVDDQSDVRLLIKMIVDAANDGLFVKGAVASGEEALAVVDDVDPTVIVLDEMMPGMSGIETAEALRRRRPGQLMIMCSAYLDHELRARAEEAGILLCLPKEKVADIPEALRAIAKQHRNGNGRVHSAG